MKEGVMVLHYSADCNQFERKLLKVDDQLRFMYLLDGQSKALANVNSKLASIVTIPLHHIKHVYAMDEAMRICEENGLDTEAMNLHIDSAFAMFVDSDVTKEAPDLDEEMVPIDKAYIFMAAPQQELRRCIQSCKDFNEGTSLEHSGNATAALRVDQVQLQDVEELLSKETGDFKFDISFRGQHSLRTVMVFVEVCDKPDLGGLQDKLSAELLPIDLSRVYFVIQDSITLRRAILSMSTLLFRKGVTKFVTDWGEIARPLPDELNVSEALEEAAVIWRMLSSNAADYADCHYNECSTRATITALKHMFQLEKDFSDLLQSKYSNDVRDDILRAQYETMSDGEGADEEQAGDVDNLIKTKRSLAKKWRCSNCRFINAPDEDVCEVCGTASDNRRSTSKDAPATSGIEEQQRTPKPKALASSTGSARSVKGAEGSDQVMPTDAQAASPLQPVDQLADAPSEFSGLLHQAAPAPPRELADQPADAPSEFAGLLHQEEPDKSKSVPPVQKALLQPPKQPKRGAGGIAACTGGQRCPQQ